MTLGDKLKHLRIKNNLTQKDLADSLHVTFQTVSKWENDTNEPDMATLKELAKILNCPISYFYSDEEETPVEQKEEPVREEGIGGYAMTFRRYLTLRHDSHRAACQSQNNQ